MKDVYFKDEGDFVTVIAMTDKAKQVLKDSFLPRNYPAEHKFDIELSECNAMLTFCISHGLSVDSEVPITIPEKPRVPAYDQTGTNNMTTDSKNKGTQRSPFGIGS